MKKHPIALYVILLFTVLIFSTLAYTIYNGSQELKSAPSPKKEIAVTDKSVKDSQELDVKEDQKKFVESTVEERVNRLLKTMTIEEKLGQLMIIGFQQTDIDPQTEYLLKEKNIGGVILFNRNMKSPSQVASLTNQLQKISMGNSLQIPAMIGIDQEGGDILRMREEVSPIPSFQRLGHVGNVEDVLNISKVNGKELHGMGIHVNFSPVLDLSDEDSRSFGSDSNKAALLGTKVIEGLTSEGVVGTLKHFPGNGRSGVDPHIDTSSVEATEEVLENNDIFPFKQIINEVENDQFLVMVTHIKYPTYDKENPASLSSEIITEVLRGKLGYSGIVVTDDLEMGAVNKYYPYRELGSKAIQAGADLLLVCHEYENQMEVYDGLLDAVKSGEISEERIDQSVKRILTYKLTAINVTVSDPQRADKIVGSKEHINIIKQFEKKETNKLN